MPPSLHKLRHAPTVRRIGRVVVRLSSDHPRVAKDFAALYPPAGDEACGGKVISIDVRRAGWSRIGQRLYQVSADGVEVGGWRPLSGVFPFIEWAINLRIIATQAHFLQLHAASMCFGGAGYVFPGNSGCGKSTLASILLARGWQYLCDEFALIRPDDLTLEPFPKALCIKSGSFSLIRKLGLRFARTRDYIKGPKGRVGYVAAPPHDPGAQLECQVPVRFLIFPRYSGAQHAHLQPLSRAQAALELLQCSFNRSVFSNAALPLISRLVTQAQCFRLEVGHPQSTAELLESLVARKANESETAPSTPHITKPEPSANMQRLRSRRELLRMGAKLAYAAPVVLTLSSRQAFAAASDPSGVCSTAAQTGQLCETDMDCCSRQCNLGVCR